MVRGSLAVALAVFGCGVARSAPQTYVGRGDDLVVTVTSSCELPGKNILPKGIAFEKGLKGWHDVKDTDFVPKGGPNGENAVRLKKSGAGMWRPFPLGLVKTNGTYSLACWIRTCENPGARRSTAAGIGCGLGTWQDDWKRGTGYLDARGESAGTWRRVIGKYGQVEAAAAYAQFSVGSRYFMGDGLVAAPALYRGEAMLTVSATAPAPIREVRVRGENGERVFDSGVMTNAPSAWTRDIAVSPAQTYEVMVIASDGDVACVAIGKTSVVE